ncbi:hypothetical protein OHD62_23645 [Mesorhizobium sp. YC-39]|uniref:hypothetical protein n=1 Tax=unclassified Mesorhizobium TaxID=325217 RepID=UPI0021E7AA45|nr:MULTISPECIES: hypothetical protein [unclassified Mesorhizobium]MCV3209272.1 hypothetical protein [Mesorhizobium sp. YC-2]MCV3231378.1 hypothetical protein [Mesorhizobium sp. YC-39]
MSSRYATIITDDDGREVVSAIGQFEGAVPKGRVGHFEAVPAGVLIGMVRGGPVDAVGGFGFPQAGVSGSAVGLVRAKLKALPEAVTSDAARAKAKAKPRGSKRTRKKPVRKTTARANTARKPEMPGLAEAAE